MKKYILFLVLISSALISEQKEHQSLMATLFVQNSAESYTNSMSIYKAAEDQLEKVVENNGTVLIPSFAMGRSQDILMILQDSDFDLNIHYDGMGKKITKTMLECP